MFTPFALDPGSWVYSHDLGGGGKGALKSIKNLLFAFYSPVELLNVSCIGYQSQVV